MLPTCFSEEQITGRNGAGMEQQNTTQCIALVFHPTKQHLDLVNLPLLGYTGAVVINDTEEKNSSSF